MFSKEEHVGMLNIHTQSPDWSDGYDFDTFSPPDIDNN